MNSWIWTKRQEPWQRRGAPIEYYELRDKQTKKSFDKHVWDGMTTDEKNEYMDENVYPLRKYYRVFNAEAIEGISVQERREIDPTGYNERAERKRSFLRYPITPCASRTLGRGTL